MPAGDQAHDQEANSVADMPLRRMAVPIHLPHHLIPVIDRAAARCPTPKP
jgi:hypothetical protein